MLVTAKLWGILLAEQQSAAIQYHAQQSVQGATSHSSQADGHEGWCPLLLTLPRLVAICVTCHKELSLSLMFSAAFPTACDVSMTTHRITKISSIYSAVLARSVEWAVLLSISVILWYSFGTSSTYPPVSETQSLLFWAHSKPCEARNKIGPFVRPSGHTHEKTENGKPILMKFDTGKLDVKTSRYFSFHLDRTSWTTTLYES
jgi:hypothetical protein